MSTLSRCRKPGNGKAAALDRYKVKLVPVHRILPSPENDDIYGEVGHDEEMDALIDSIQRKGLEEPILLTKDYYVLSGHRRLFACKFLGLDEVPCRITATTREGNDQYHRDLADYNPQRVKSVGSLLKEALLRDQSPEDTAAALDDYHRTQVEVDVDFLKVEGEKHVRDVSDAKRPFLAAVQKVLEDLRSYLPVSIRQIHYNLLNKPPLKTVPKRSKFDLEHYRYKNDADSYNCLVELLKSARYHGHVSMKAIDDPTRPQVVPNGWDNVSEFVHAEIEGFLRGYHRHRQQGQPRHIEVFAEKNTLMNILQPVVSKYYVPMSLGRGFCSTPIWRDMAQRFRESGRTAMTLIVVSDFDPEGLALADDAIRTLRDLWRIPVDYHRVGVTREQIDELNLALDFNPAKDSSKHYPQFVKRTGDTKTWECEAIPPAHLADQLEAAIVANMDTAVYDEVVATEVRDWRQLYDAKKAIAGELDLGANF